MATNPSFANIHDVTLETGIVPSPREPWQAYLTKLKAEARKQGKMWRSLMMKPGYGPTIDQLPTHYWKREGKRLYGKDGITSRDGGKPFEWPQLSPEPLQKGTSHTTKGSQEYGLVNCVGTDQCFYMTSRGYLCARHMMNYTDLELVSVQKASPEAVKNAKHIKVWIT